MKTFYTITIICLILSPTIYGCASLVKERHEVVPISQPQIFEITINEKTTTKEEIIDVLGMPDSIENNLDYTFERDKKCKVHLIKKDGTVWNVILGDNEKFRKMFIVFVDKKYGFSCGVTIR